MYQSLKIVSIIGIVDDEFDRATKASDQHSTIKQISNMYLPNRLTRLM